MKKIKYRNAYTAGGIDRNFRRGVSRDVGDGVRHYILKYVWDRVSRRINSSCSRLDFFNNMEIERDGKK